MHCGRSRATNCNLDDATDGSVPCSRTAISFSPKIFFSLFFAQYPSCTNVHTAYEGGKQTGGLVDCRRSEKFFSSSEGKYRFSKLRGLVFVISFSRVLSRDYV